MIPQQPACILIISADGIPHQFLHFAGDYQRVAVPLLSLSHALHPIPMSTCNKVVSHIHRFETPS